MQALVPVLVPEQAHPAGVLDGWPPVTMGLVLGLVLGPEQALAVQDRATVRQQIYHACTVAALQVVAAPPRPA